MQAGEREVMLHVSFVAKHYLYSFLKGVANTM